MTELPVRRTGRPPKVSTEAILDAAALIRADELTFASLADTLGISVQTVYYYFPNRVALLRAMTARAVAALDPPDLTRCDDWREALSLVGRWIYATLRDRPEWELKDAGTRGVLSQVMMPCIQALRAQGFDETAATGALLLVANFATAMAASAEPTERVSSPRPDNSGRQVYPFVPNDAAEETLLRTLAPHSVDEWFEIGLDAAIAGVKVSFAPAWRRRPR